MKTTKILIALCIVLGFATNEVDAQAVVENGIYSDGYYIECTGEWAYGDIKYHFETNKNVHYFSLHGKLIGAESGTVYLINDTKGQQLILNNEGVAWTFKWDYVVHANGKPIMRGKGHAHVTANANGTVTAEFWGDEFECLND